MHQQLSYLISTLADNSELCFATRVAMFTVIKMTEIDTKWLFFKKKKKELTRSDTQQPKQGETPLVQKNKNKKRVNNENKNK